jgi:hypothetical protein
VDSIDRSQNSHGGELDESKEVGTKFVIARRDAAKLLQSVEEALDAIAFAIKGLGPPVLGFAIESVRYVRDRTLVTDMRADVVGVIGLVGDDDGTVLEPIEQGVGARGVMRLARRDQEQTGRPFASTRAWIFVVMPPRLRPTQRSPLFFWDRRR